MDCGGLRCDYGNVGAVSLETSGQLHGSREGRDGNVTMLDFDQKQQDLLADKLFDAGNVAAGGIVFGQFVANRPFSIVLAVIGLAIWVTLLIAIVAVGRSQS
jgi:hypothetical protein